MVAGESRHFFAADRFQLTAGDLAAVLLELNGRSVPSDGTAGVSGTIVLPGVLTEAMTGALTGNGTRQATSGNTQR